jgi:hypothetical protein
MSEFYERGFVGTSQDVFSEELFWLLVKHGYLRKVEFDIRKAESVTITELKSIPQVEKTYGLKIEPEDNILCNQYIGNGMPIESNFEAIAKAHLGVCEDRKEWEKQLRKDVKEHGHDVLLESFFEWTQAQAGVFLGRKPVTAFLKNINQNIMTPKPVVTNALLDKTDRGIALLTDNKVFFTGQYRVRLAQLLKEHGLNPVNQAFAEFWNSLDEKRHQWAAQDFLQRAEVMISTNKLREQQAIQQAQAVAKAIANAKQQVETPEEEDEEL